MSRRVSLRTQRPSLLSPLRLSSSLAASRAAYARHFRPRGESLEARTMMSVSPVFYSVTGAGNNQAQPNWGAANQGLLRTILPAHYVDGVSSMAGQIDPATGQVNSTLPSARLISNQLGDQVTEDLDQRNLSAFTYAWGQFIDHDLDLTLDGGTSVPISVPKGDPQFDLNSQGGMTLPFTRSLAQAGTGAGTSTPLNQTTVVTSFLDGSQVYGSDPARAAALRAGVGGLLNTSAGNLLPLNSDGKIDNADDGPFPATDMFVAGDRRANENIELTALQTLFMREHNRQAANLARLHPTWGDEQLFQGARQIVIAEIQSITFNQFLPALLGTSAIAPYSGYKANVNPGITPEFSEAAFRFGHTQLDDDVEFLNDNGTNMPFSYTIPGYGTSQVNTPDDVANGETGMSLVDAFFNPYVLHQPGVIEGIFKYLASDNAQAVDTQMVASVRNILFGAPGSGAGGQDLFALDVQRGRDVGLPTYNEARVAYGLPAVTKFSQITSDPAIQAQLKALYGDVSKVELFVGGLAEDHVRGSSLGATFQAIIANQFQRLRDGDRLWFQNTFSGADLKAVQNVTLADLIRANTTSTNLQSNVFIFEASITGKVFLDLNGNGRQNLLEFGLPNLTVQLLDDGGNVLGSTRTARDGSYSFGDLELDTYTIQVSLPRNLQATFDPVTLQVTRSGSTTIDLGIKLKSTRPGGGLAGELQGLLNALGVWLQQVLSQVQNGVGGQPGGAGGR